MWEDQGTQRRALCITVPHHICDFIPLDPRNKTTYSTAMHNTGVIFYEVIARFGCPYDIHSDQRCNYESAIFSELCHLLEIQKTRVTPGHLHCNGQVEQFNRTLVRMIKSYLKGQQHNWALHLSCFYSFIPGNPT